MHPVESNHEFQLVAPPDHQEEEPIVPLPTPPPPDFSLVVFSAEVDHPSQMLIYDCSSRLLLSHLTSIH